MQSLQASASPKSLVKTQLLDVPRAIHNLLELRQAVTGFAGPWL